MRDDIKKKAYSLLERVDLTPRMLLDRLSERMPDESREEIKSVIRELTERGVVNIARFGERVIETQKARLYGHRRIEDALIIKRFPKKYIESVSGMIEFDEAERALRCLEARAGRIFANYDINPEETKKLFNYLIRQGYDYRTAGEALENYKKGKEQA
ncbi:MAG: RecX family transcriptional regulator [Oscillospiraceae bacterium]|nr:RecX family transcriptional regulator [Oscillospiraceae bacterium]